MLDAPRIPPRRLHIRTAIAAATDLIAWAKLIRFTDHPALARCEIETFRDRVLHVAARITPSARQLCSASPVGSQQATPFPIRPHEESTPVRKSRPTTQQNADQRPVAGIRAKT
jgi:hypothetical protein